MFYQPRRYTVHGSWAAMPVRPANAQADLAIMASPAVLAAMAKIDRAFGKADRPQ